MKILLDGMDGDNAPLEIVKGAVTAADLIEDEIYIIGKQEEIREALSKQNYEGDKITICDAREVISMEDSPVRAVRVKKDSSIVKGINMVKSGEADLFVSAGNSGALMAGGLFILGRIPGIDRPAMASIYPILGKEAALLIDAGANLGLPISSWSIDIGQSRYNKADKNSCNHSDNRNHRFFPIKKQKIRRRKGKYKKHISLLHLIFYSGFGYHNRRYKFRSFNGSLYSRQNS